MALSLSGILGAPVDYGGGSLGTGQSSDGVALNTKGTHLHIGNQSSDQITSARVRSGCVLAKGTIRAFGGTAGIDNPTQIAVSGVTVFSADFNFNSMTMVSAPSLGIFHARTNGSLVPLNASGPLYPLTTVQFAAPFSVALLPEKTE
jgi:hypothetical protein